MAILRKNETPHDYRTRFNEQELRLLKEFKTGKVLEVCSGDGRNLVRLYKAGYNVAGIESPDFLDDSLTRKNGIVVFLHPIYGKRFPFGDATFDFIYSYQYLNHNFKEEIKDVFKEIFRVLKKDGLFSIKITDIEQFNIKRIKNNIYEECNPEFPKIKYKKVADQTFVKLEGPEKGVPHYAFYRKELVELLERIGFKLINVRKIKWNLVGNFRK